MELLGVFVLLNITPVPQLSLCDSLLLMDTFNIIVFIFDYTFFLLDFFILRH